MSTLADDVMEQSLLVSEGVWPPGGGTFGQGFDRARARGSVRGTGGRGMIWLF